jgi:hypothetical protein
VNPWGDNAVALCGTPDRSPLPLGPLRESRQLEPVLEQLVPAFLSMRDKLDLTSAIWQYWLAREATADVGLMIISAAVNGLATRWLQSSRSKTQGIYLPKDEFSALTRGEFTAIREKLAHIPGRDFIMRTLESAFEIRGVVLKRDTFLSEIDLPIGSVEREAFKARNAPAHGTGAGTREEQRKMIRAVDAYICTFERIVLKLLDYAGEYIDYTAPNYPRTPLNQPLAGWST